MALNRFELLIGGEWEKSHSGRYKDLINPSNGSIVAQCAMADKTDGGKAIGIAREAFERGEWSELSLEKRAAVLKRAGEIMKERAEELNALEMANCGKPIRQASFFDFQWPQRAWTTTRPLKQENYERESNSQISPGHTGSLIMNRMGLLVLLFLGMSLY